LDNVFAPSISKQITEPLKNNRWVSSLVVALLTAAVWIGYGCFPAWQKATGIYDTGKLFWDLDGLLASGEAARQGLDPFLPNPLDFYHRPHVYTEWWLITGRIGWGRAHTLWIGIALMVVTLTSALMVVRPMGWRQIGMAWLCLASPALLMALDRANNDLVVFVLMCAAFLALSKTAGSLRALGIVLLAVAAVLKYYPLATLILLLDARSRREFLYWVLLVGLVFLLAWPALEPGLRAAFKYRPNPEWLYAFGAPVIFRDLGIVVQPRWLWAGFGLGTIVATWSLRGKGALSTAAPSQSGKDELAFIGGAAMLLGCFVLGSSYAYKLIFSLWLLPWLWRSEIANAERRWKMMTWVSLFAVLWLEGLLAVILNTWASSIPRELALRLLKSGLVVSQLFTWVLMICLLRRLMAYCYGRITFHRDSRVIVARQVA
jgi:hypothetical protein